MSASWDGLRKQARALENSIDVKLVSLNKLNSNSSSNRYESSDKSTLASRQSVFDGLCEDLDALVNKLTNINDQMSELVAREEDSGSAFASNAALQHTLRRHRDILRDYVHEFHRARDNVKAQLQREQLLSGGSSPTSQDGLCLNNRVKASDMYLKEADHISSCDRLIDEQISIAMSTKENLARQGMNLRGVTKKMNQIAKKYPMIGSVMQKIQSKKRRDTVVLAGVISTCLIFFFIYTMH